MPAASKAADAEKLGGADPSAYLARVAQATPATFTSLALTANTATDVTFGGPLAITVPNGVKFVVIDATASFVSPSAAVATLLWIAADSPNCAGTSGIAYENRTYGEIANTAGDGREVQSYHLVLPVTAGAHSYRLCAYSGAGTSSLFTRELSVMTVPAGPTG